MGLKYIREIDGLRAIAVLAVVTYHAGIIESGFVGVDVFFVISGYLITSLLIDDITLKGRPDYIAFYSRRMRRIFPAAIVVITTCAWAAFLLLPPAEMKAVFQSASAAIIFSANFFFQYTTGDYFDAPAAQMPLLHLWSLGVEEQFYIIWPITLTWIVRIQHPRTAVLVTAILSLLLAQWLIGWHQEWAFFQMPPRFWELATGGMIAMGPRKSLSPWAPTLGLILTIAACLFRPPQFPGLGAIPAVAGAATICAAAHGSRDLGLAGYILRSRIMVAIGLVSYSFYLWHWPLLAFYRATSVGETELGVRIMLCVLALVLAIVSYRYIEQPIRRAQFSSKQATIFGAVASVILSLSMYVLGSQLALHYPADPFPLATQAERDIPPFECRYKWDESKVPKCPDPIGAKVVIWGDSMAFAWRPLMPEPVVDLSHDSCPPLLKWLPDDANRGDFICRDFEAAAMRHIGGQPALVIVARWQLGGSQSNALRRTLEAASAKVNHIVLIGPTPEMRDTVPRCIRKHAEAECAISRKAFDRHAAPIMAALRNAAEGIPNVTVVDVTDYFCSTTNCPPVKNGVPLYWDSHHPTMTAVVNAKTFEPLARALTNAIP